MTAAPDEAWRRALDDALAAGQAVSVGAIAPLAAAPPAALEGALREVADRHGAAALPVLVTLGESAHGGVRRLAKRTLYRLAQRGITPAPRAPARPVVDRGEARATRAWMSAVDGSGSRALWVVFEDGFGGLELCSLIVNDVAGIREVAGGGITRKRLESELAKLRAAQKLPWVETEPARAVGLVAEAVALHRTLGTSPPAAFSRWLRRFDVALPAPPVPPADADPELVARGAELLEAPEMAGWLHEGELDPEARARWARRLMEMITVFEATERAEMAPIARAAAAALVGPDTDPGAQPFARALVRRG